MTNPKRPIVHRPLLDGTRGVMMMVVLGYHLDGPTRLPGAWVSMDFFFVLSGYLITTLLVREYEVRGSLDLRNFYRRRVRRLAPALLLTLAGLFVLAAFLGRDTFSDLRGDGLATLFYVNNWHLIWSSQSYFSSFDVSPLRHAWSLAIEEQFYIAWPIIFWALAKVTRFDRRKMMAGLAVAGLASAYWMRRIALRGEDLSRAYYGTDTRGQALVVGTILGLFLWYDRWDDERGRRVGSWLGTAALGVLIVMMIVFTDHSRYVYTDFGFLLIAVVSAVFVFGCARATSGPLVWIFGNRLSRHFGVISYCFYLWHWPVIVIFDEQRTGLSWGPRALLQTTISVLLAELTYWLLERPVHTRRWRIDRMGLTFGGAFVVVMSLLLVTTIGAGSSDAEMTGQRSSGADEASADVLVVGDSLAWLLSGTAPDDYGYHVDGEFRAHCDIIGDRIHTGDRIEEADAECGTWPDAWGGRLEADDPDVVLVSLGLRQLFDPDVDGERLPLGSDRWSDEYERAVGRAVDVLRDRTDAPIFWLDVACYEWSEVSVDGEEHDADRIDLVDTELRRILATADDITVVDYRDRVCDGPRRDQVDFDLRPDGAHLTPDAAADLWWALEPAFDEALGR